jgi:hypothetical protein
MSLCPNALSWTEWLIFTSISLLIFFFGIREGESPYGVWSGTIDKDFKWHPNLTPKWVKFVVVILVLLILLTWKWQEWFC